MFKAFFIIPARLFLWKMIVLKFVASKNKTMIRLSFLETFALKTIKEGGISLTLTKISFSILSTQ